jgi:phage FluMu gp28-like protein
MADNAGPTYKQKIGDDMIAWAVNMLSYSDGTPWIADWWQTWYLKSNSSFLIANKSRRIGWSYITAVKGLLTALDPAVNGYTKQYVSYSLEDATEKIKNAVEFYDSIPEISRPKRLVSRTRTRLEFQDLNGRSISRLISLPCRQPRGKGGDISLDEFAFHQKDSEIYTAAVAVTSRGGNIEIGSTPFGNKGRFYEIMTDVQMYRDYKRYSIPWYMSPALCTDVQLAVTMANELTTEKRVEQFGTEKLKSILRSMPVDDFMQEYECFYRDDLASFITLDMIRACTPEGVRSEDADDEDTIEIHEYKRLDDFILAYDPAIHGSLYAGYDVGRTNDASELIVLGHNPLTNNKTLHCRITLKKTGFDAQQDMLERFLNGVPVHRLAIDGTGLGMDLAERLERKYPKRVEKCTFTSDFKEVIANGAWLAFDRREYLLPPDKDLQMQIHSIRKTTTAGKHARFDCDANSQNHADAWWAFALATYAIDAGPTNTERNRFYKQYQERKRGGSVETEEDKHDRGHSAATILNRMNSKRFV